MSNKIYTTIVFEGSVPTCRKMTVTVQGKEQEVLTTRAAFYDSLAEVDILRAFVNGIINDPKDDELVAKAERAIEQCDQLFVHPIERQANDRAIRKVRGAAALHPDFGGNGDGH